MKKLIFSAAILLSCTVLSFAGSPKGDAKAETTDAPTISDAATGETRYYFLISDDGNLFISSSVSTAQNQPQCDGLDEAFCATGLTNDQVDIVGGTAMVKPSIVPSDGLRTHKD